MAQKARITITVDGEVLKRIDRIASAKKQSRSAWFADAISDSVEQDEVAVKFLSDPLLRDTFVRAFGQPGMLASFSKAIGAELSDDQLKLFAERITSVVQQEPFAQKVPPFVKPKKKGKR